MSAFRNIFAVLLLAIAMPTLAGEPPKPAAIVSPTTTTQADALAALEGILAAYSEGQALRAEAMVEPAMIGRQQLIDAMRLSIAQQKQIRISLHDTQMVNGDDVVVLRTGWDKRYLTLPDMAPMVRKGQTLFLMQLTKQGWKLAGQSGDNLFAQ